MALDENKLQKEQPDEERHDTIVTSTYPRLDIPEGEKPELLDYLVSLPDVDVDLPPIPEAKNKPEPQMEEKTEEENKAEALASFIRNRTKAAQVCPFAMLYSENEDVGEVLENFSGDEAFNDIVYIKGDKDTYYYSNKTMTEYYANIAILVEEKNDSRTVAHSVREHSKYPAPTPVQFFMKTPFFLSSSQLDQVRNIFKIDPNYEDIKEFKLDNGMEYFYSTLSLTHYAAFSLAEDAMNATP